MERHRARLRLVPCLLALATLACGGGGERQASGGDGPQRFSVAGEIEIAFGTAVDGDVNDPTAPLEANDTLGTAQELPNPVTLGGYVNQPGSGEAGRSFAGGDVRDLFRISLAMGQMVRLFAAEEGPASDLDLALLALDGSEVAVSDGDGGVEEITVPASGDYVLEVAAFAGASNYVLSVVASSVPAAAPAASDWVPGQVIVRFRETKLHGATAPLLAERAQALRLSLVARGPDGVALLASRDPVEMGEALRHLGVGHLAQATDASPGRPGRLRLRRATRRLAKALRRRADVLSADPNYVRQPSAVPVDELYARQWHYPLIRLPEAWENVAPASGVVVAVIDTGVVSAHPDLQGQLVPGYDFIQDLGVSLDGDGCDTDPEDPGDGLAGAGSYHGTHVTGTLAARTSLQPAGDKEGVAGVAWNARVMPLRVLGRGGGTDFDLIQAMRYAAGLDNACGALPAQRADVINLSLGGPDASAALDAAVQDVRMAGLSVVAAAGNFSSSAPFYPASSPGVISVSAVDAAKALAPYSNFGASIDVAAPGGNLADDLGGDGYPDGVLSTLLDATGQSPEFDYGFYHGTSMATPHVTGVIALMLGVNPDLTPDDLDALLASGAMTQDLGSALSFGHGLIDAFAAVDAAFEAQGGTPPSQSPRLEASPAALLMGALGTLADVELANPGGNQPPPQVTAVVVTTDDGAPWLSVEAAGVDAAGLGRYRIRVDRGQVTEGIYTGMVLFTSNANDVEVPVVMQKGSFAALDPDAGHHFVLLVDAESLETVQALAVDAAGGHYLYRFDAVEAGEYLLIAGTDADNDFVICDPGEACGAFATLDEPEKIAVDGNRAGLDFLTGFDLRLSGAAAGLPQSGRSRSRLRRSALLP